MEIFTVQKTQNNLLELLSNNKNVRRVPRLLGGLDNTVGEARRGLPETRAEGLGLHQVETLHQAASGATAALHAGFTLAAPSNHSSSRLPVNHAGVVAPGVSGAGWVGEQL